MLLMGLPTFNISPRRVTGIIGYTGSGSVGSGFVAMRWNFRHFRSIMERELVYVFSVRFFSVHFASTNFTSDVGGEMVQLDSLSAYTMYSTNRVVILDNVSTEQETARQLDLWIN
jgi:hypothetical protein